MSRNKVVVITGASAGVGRATAHAFAQRGARLGLIARDPAALEQVKEEVERFGVTALVAAADVAEADAVFSAAERIANHFGAIDVWVNNAMVTVFAPVWELTPEEFRRVTEVTYFGCVHGTMAALRHMRPRNRGAIIQVGSALAYRGIPLQSGYCGAKHAIRGFTNSLRTELIHDGSAITVTTMELPAVNTPQFDWARTHMARQPRPVPPVVQPEVIADAIVCAAAKPQREYWIGLSTLKIILGNTLLPRFLDRYLARRAFEQQETSRPVSPGREDNLQRPVSDLHRTRGAFGNEASSDAFVINETTARLAPVMAGALLFFLVGVLGKRLLPRGRREARLGAGRRRLISRAGA